MKKILKITVGLLLVSLLFAVTLQAQDSFWFGNPIAEFLDPNTIDAYHDFLESTVLPALQGPIMMPNNNPEDDQGVTIYDPDRCWNGYTLLCSMGGHQSDPNGPVCSPILVDMEGNLVKEWALGTFAVPMKMLPGGYVMGAIPGKGILAQLDWDGNVVWNSGLSYHHDYQREGNPVGYYAPGMEARVDGGKTLVLSNALPDPNLTTHISDFPLLDEMISEHDWEANVLWQWKAWEHFEQMGFDDAAKDAIRTKFVQFMNPKATDYLHFNCASWLGPNKWYDQGDLRFHPDNIIFDGRSVNIIAIIARHDHPEGLWASGDIVWRVGPDYSAGHPENKLGQIIGQHMAHMIPQGLPGAGNILLFDNGGMAGFGALVPGSSRGSYPNTLRDFSRVIEFDPVTLDLVWEWKQPSPTADCDGDGDIKCEERKFFSVFISGAQRLENGNTMICEGATGRIFEVTSDGDIVWEYISPYTGGAKSPFKQRSVYRAYRVPASWLPQVAGN